MFSTKLKWWFFIMENIKISIVVPVYNAAKYLPRCLDSVLTQDYSNLEIICVNDGSTDESLSVLQVYVQKDERVKVLSQFNQGAAAARNKGIKNATGDYISFIDADDFVAQGLYSYLVQNLQNDLVDIFMFNGVVNNKGGFFSEKNFYHPVAECQNVTCKDFYGIFFGNSGVCNKIYKRSFIEQNKLLFLQANCFEDIEFWFKSLIAAQAVKVSFKQFYHYCMDNENSVTRTFGANALSLFEMFQAMMKEAQKRGLFAFFNEALLQYQYEKITETLFLMKPAYQERFYQKAKEFLSRRCSQMVGNRYKNLLDFNICYNILINDFIDFKNTTLLFRENFHYMEDSVADVKFSIVVPVYNVEPYLTICLKSLINQTFKNFEIICVNDGSTDKSLDILNYHAQRDSRIKIINQENKGLGAARNVGVAAAKGEYLLFVDSDDWLRTDALEVLDNRSKAQDFDVCIFGYNNYINQQQYNLPTRILTGLEKQKFEHAYDYMFVNVIACGKAYKRDFWQKYNFKFAEGVFFEDNITNAQVFSLAQTCDICEQYFYYYRINNDSITHTMFSDKKIADLFLSLEGVCSFLREQSFYEDIKAKLTSFVQNCLAAHQAKVPLAKQDIYAQKRSELLKSI